jgi:hypothetical protein
MQFAVSEVRSFRIGGEVGDRHGVTNTLKTCY